MGISNDGKRAEKRFEPDDSAALGVTSTHCWVLLYRARMALRECLEKSWFGK